MQLYKKCDFNAKSKTNIIKHTTLRVSDYITKFNWLSTNSPAEMINNIEHNS